MAGLANRHTYVAVIVGVLVGILTVAGTFVVAEPTARPAGSVTLNGVWMNITYAPGSSEPWPVSTINCTGTASGAPTYHCPLNLTGGIEFSLAVFYSLVVPPNDTAIFNDTIWSPLPFHEPSCSAIPCPLTNRWEDRGVYVEGGLYWGDPVTLAVPSPAPTLVHGFWVVANVSMNVVPGYVLPPGLVLG